MVRHAVHGSTCRAFQCHGSRLTFSRLQGNCLFEVGRLFPFGPTCSRSLYWCFEPSRRHHLSAPPDLIVSELRLEQWKVLMKTRVPLFNSSQLIPMPCSAESLPGLVFLLFSPDLLDLGHRIESLLTPPHVLQPSSGGYGIHLVLE